MSRVLFVAVEINAARYFLPLWRRWQGAGRRDWSIVLGDMAAEHLKSTGTLEALPVIASLPRQSSASADIARNVRPECVVASAGDAYPLERAAVAWARAHGRRSIQAIDTWYNYARRFRDLAREEFPDIIGVIDERSKAEASAENLPANLLKVIGQPAWEQSGPLPRPDAKRTLFLGAPVMRDYGDELGYDEWQALDVARDVAHRRPDLMGELLFGPHPVQRDVPPARIAPARIVSDSMSALSEAEIVLGMFSSPMVDAFLGGRRVISLQPGTSARDMCPLSRHGRVPRVRNTEELEAALMHPASTSDDLRRDLARSCDRLEAAIEKSAA